MIAFNFTKERLLVYEDRLQVMESEVALVNPENQLGYDQSVIGFGGCILLSIVAFLLFLSLILFIAYGRQFKWEATHGTNYRLISCFGYNVRPLFDRVSCRSSWKKSQDDAGNTYEKPVDATHLAEIHVHHEQRRFTLPSHSGSEVGSQRNSSDFHDGVLLTPRTLTNDDTAGPSGNVPRCIARSPRQSNAQMTLNSSSVQVSSLRLSKRSSKNMKTFFEKFPFRRSMAKRKSLPIMRKTSAIDFDHMDFRERPLPPVPSSDSTLEPCSRHRSKSLNIPRQKTKEAEFFNTHSPIISPRRPNLPSSAERKASNDFRKMSNLVTSNSHEMLEFVNFSSDSSRSLAMFRRHISSRSTQTDFEPVVGADRTLIHTTRSFSVDQARYSLRGRLAPRNLRRSRSLDLCLDVFHETPGYLRLSGEVAANKTEPAPYRDVSPADTGVGDDDDVVFTKLTENPGYGKVASPKTPRLSRIESMYAKIPDDFRSNAVSTNGPPPETSYTTSATHGRQIPRRPRNSGLPPIPVANPIYTPEPFSPHPFTTTEPPSEPHDYERASTINPNYERVGAPTSEQTRRLSDQFSSFRSTSSSGSRPYARIPDIMPNLDAKS